MSMQDTIADLLTRIRNAQAAKKSNVRAPYSRMKEDILNVLRSEGYIKSFKDIKDPNPSQRYLDISLKYYQGSPVISKIKRVSKPGLRVYCRKDNFPKVLGGLGTAIVSTAQGVVSDKAAQALGLGGEVLAIVE